ncbi:iron uptake system protein EfeO [Pseudonocardia phyllosphaerae]|uniref:iron uptake system protein EfeO n=1 Tax=Pseudonocardia phyllosphaerae TaxID=3390502 RepID=UPI003979EF15
MSVSSTPPRRLLTVTGLLAASAMVLSACGGSDSGAAPPAGDAQQGGPAAVTVTLANEGGTDSCKPDKDSVPAGPVTFTVTNTSAAGITEVELLKDQRIVGEKENLAPGLAPVSFTATLDGGAYQLYCPGAGTDHVPFTVTGQAAAPPSGSTQQILAQGSKEYAGYVSGQIDQLATGAAALNTAVQSGNVEQSRTAYAKARTYYEHAESSVEGFVLPGFSAEDNAGNLDYLIDMRSSTPVDDKVGWSGFHAIERDLWKAKKITPQTKKYAADLVTNVGKLKSVVGSLSYKPEDLANGAADLLEEVQNSKITGEEEEFSHIDLVDFAGNVEGAQQAYASLRPGLVKIDANLVQTIDKQFESVLSMLDTYRDPSAPGGFKVYTPQLRASDAKKLTAAIQPLHDSLAAIAQKVV